MIPTECWHSLHRLAELEERGFSGQVRLAIREYLAGSESSHDDEDLPDGTRHAEQRTPIGVRVPIVHVRALERLARSNGRPRAAEVRRAVRMHVARAGAQQEALT